MKQIFLLIGLFLTVQTMAQDFVREKDRKTGKVCLRGLITFEDIKKETDNKWFPAGIKNYIPDENTTEELKKYAKPYRFIVFLGTWCEDSHVLIPQLYNVLTSAGIDLHAVEIFGVNRDKEALNIETKLYNIQRVPTIIVMHQNREVGRIIESVNTTVEEELLKIIAPDFAKLEQKRINRFN